MDDNLGLLNITIISPTKTLEPLKLDDGHEKSSLDPVLTGLNMKPNNKMYQSLNTATIMVSIEKFRLADWHLSHVPSLLREVCLSPSLQMPTITKTDFMSYLPT